MTRYPWLTPRHRMALVQARKILEDLLDPSLAGVQSNTDERHEIQRIMGDIEKLLGY